MPLCVRINNVVIGLIVFGTVSIVALTYYAPNDVEMKSVPDKRVDISPSVEGSRLPTARSPLSTGNAGYTIESPSIRQAQKQYLEQYPLSASLEDVEIDGEIHFDEQGKLIRSRELRRLFDMLLTQENERDELSIRAWLVGYAKASVIQSDDPSLGIDQVIASFDNYLGYLAAASRMLPDIGASDIDTLTQVKHAKESISALRLETFGGAIANNYFGNEEAYDRSQLEYASIQQDSTLTKKEKEFALEMWQFGIENESQRNRIQEHKQLNLIRETVAQLQSNKASTDEIYAVRRKAYGEEAANRLQELDVKKEIWRKRLEAYQQVYEKLVGDQSISKSEVRLQIQDYAETHFGKTEQLRLPLFD